MKPLETNIEASELVIMGRVAAPYGVLGWLKVIPDTEIFDGLLDYDHWWIGKAQDWQAHKVESAKVHNDVLAVKLSGINDRDAAVLCKGKQIAVPRAWLPKPEAGEYYWSDLIGLAVKNTQNIDFGKITEVLETGANDVIVVKGDSERLIPFVAQTILDVNLESQIMLVDWDEDF